MASSKRPVFDFAHRVMPKGQKNATAIGHSEPAPHHDGLSNFDTDSNNDDVAPSRDGLSQFDSDSNSNEDESDTRRHESKVMKPHGGKLDVNGTSKPTKPALDRGMNDEYDIPASPPMKGFGRRLPVEADQEALWEIPSSPEPAKHTQKQRKSPTATTSNAQSRAKAAQSQSKTATKPKPRVAKAAFNPDDEYVPSSQVPTTKRKSVQAGTKRKTAKRTKKTHREIDDHIFDSLSDQDFDMLDTAPAAVPKSKPARSAGGEGAKNASDDAQGLPAKKKVAASKAKVAHRAPTPRHLKRAANVVASDSEYSPSNKAIPAATSTNTSVQASTAPQLDIAELEQNMGKFGDATGTETAVSTQTAAREPQRSSDSPDTDGNYHWGYDANSEAIGDDEDNRNDEGDERELSPMGTGPVHSHVDNQSDEDAEDGDILDNEPELVTHMPMSPSADFPSQIDDPQLDDPQLDAPQLDAPQLDDSSLASSPMTRGQSTQPSLPKLPNMEEELPQRPAEADSASPIEPVAPKRKRKVARVQEDAREDRAKRAKRTFSLSSAPTRVMVSPIRSNKLLDAIAEKTSRHHRDSPEGQTAPAVKKRAARRWEEDEQTAEQSTPFQAQAMMSAFAAELGRSADASARDRVPMPTQRHVLHGSTGGADRGKDPGASTFERYEDVGETISQIGRVLIEQLQIKEDHIREVADQYELGVNTLVSRLERAHARQRTALIAETEAFRLDFIRRCTKAREELNREGAKLEGLDMSPIYAGRGDSALAQLVKLRETL